MPKASAKAKVEKLLVVDGDSAKGLITANASIAIKYPNAASRIGLFSAARSADRRFLERAAELVKVRVCTD